MNSGLIGQARAEKDDFLRPYAGQFRDIGLFSGVEEVTDAASRVPCLWSEPQGDETRFVDNVDEVRFESFDSEHKIDHWGVFLGGELRARYKLTSARVLEPDDAAVFRPGSLKVGML
jgi:hypothetical protein